jgi:outer membrane protein assembly factor BamB
MVADNGFFSAVDPAEGNLLYSERTGGSVSASPMVADGRIYFCNERGDCYVIQPGREYKELAHNTLPEGIMAGPVAVGSDLFLRTKTHLYLFRKAP